MTIDNIIKAAQILAAPYPEHMDDHGVIREPQPWDWMRPLPSASLNDTRLAAIKNWVDNGDAYDDRGWDAAGFAAARPEAMAIPMHGRLVELRGCEMVALWRLDAGELIRLGVSPDGEACQKRKGGQYNEQQSH